MTFRNWLEMATFGVPRNVDIEVKIDGKPYRVGYVDMRFEDPPQIRNHEGRVLNQGSPFIAKLPGRGDYLVYDGIGGPWQRAASEIEAKALQASGYARLTDDWWERAHLIGVDGHLISAGTHNDRRRLAGVA